GTPDRLDFTVIGAAVNRAARIETLTAQLGRRILVSKDFAVHCQDRMVSLGDYPLRGVAEPQEIFGLADPKAVPELCDPRTLRCGAPRLGRRGARLAQ